MNPTNAPDRPTTVPTNHPYPVWVGPAAFFAATAGLFAVTLSSLFTLWSNDPNYNHGFLVLPVAVAIGAWVFRHRAGNPGAPDRKLSTMALVIGGICHLTAVLLNFTGLDFLAIFFVVRGGLMAAGGKDWAAKFNFPLGFLLFMFPLPPQWLSWVALRLQDVAARISETVLGLFLVVSRNGHTLRIAGMDDSLVVAEECSGTRQIVAFVAMAALLGFFSSRSVVYRLLLLVCAVPVAVAANVLRVVLMNLGAYSFGTDWMGGWMHDLPALFSLPVGFLMFLAIDRTLHGIFEPKKKPEGTPAAPSTPEDQPPAEKADMHLPPQFGRRWLVAAAGVGVVLLVSLVFRWHISAGGEQSYPTLPGTFADLPLRFPGGENTPAWQGAEYDEVREKVREKLPFKADDLSYRGYQTGDGRVQATVYLVHSRAGEDRKHHPEICIREVSGAPEMANSRAKIPLAADGRSAQRFRFGTGGGQSIAVYYWHYTVQPQTQPWSPFQQIHQMIGTERPSVTVQLTTPGDDPRALAVVEKTLLPQLDAALMNNVLPPNTPAGCDRLPVVFVR